jgi:AcrR family transcriptional regulator
MERTAFVANTVRRERCSVNYADLMTQPVSRRERPAKPPLSQDAIVRAALALLEKDGLEAVSMRRVAQALDTGAASLYVYVKNRDDLLQLLLDTVIADVRLPAADTRDWRGELIRLADDSIRTLSRYRGLAGVTLGNVPSGPNSLRLVDAMLGLMLRAGVSKQAAAWAVDMIGMHVTAAAMEAALYVEREDLAHEVVEGMTTWLAAVEDETYPALAAVRPELTRGDSDQRGRWQMEVILNGVVRTPAEP